MGPMLPNLRELSSGSRASRSTPIPGDPSRRAAKKEDELPRLDRIDMQAEGGPVGARISSNRAVRRWLLEAEPESDWLRGEGGDAELDGS